VSSTPVSLLDRLKVAEPDAQEWQRLQELYQPLIGAWLSRVPGLGDEAADLTQEVLMVLIRELPRFERQREGSFRAWLRQITVNRVRTFGKLRVRRPATGGAVDTDAFLGQLEDPAGDLAREWDRQHDQHVFQKLLSAVELDFTSQTREAFRRTAIEGQPVARVAAELALSENAVVLAKLRILRRLREEAVGLID
jgi:RNA polymerase sigma-70 factor, ECF subfamily